MSDRIAPFVRNVMSHGPHADMSLTDSIFNALGHLAGGGETQEQQLAMVALGEEKKRIDGRSGNLKAIRIAWGPRSKCAAYAAQNVSIGSPHCAAVDIGGDIRHSARIQQALGSENPREFNQYRHIALVLGWCATGRKFGIPSRSRAGVLATELRASEFAESQMRTAKWINASVVHITNLIPLFAIWRIPPTIAATVAMGGFSKLCAMRRRNCAS